MESPLRSVAAFDLGTHYGWALRDTQGSIASGHVDLEQTGRIQNDGFRYLRFEAHVKAIFAAQSTEVCFFEEVRRNSGHIAATVYGGFKAKLLAECERFNVAHSSIPVGTIKAVATLQHSAGKAKVIKAAQYYYPKIEDDNEADAFWILITGLTEHLGEPKQWTKHHPPPPPTRRRKRSGSALSSPSL